MDSFCRSAQAGGGIGVVMDMEVIGLTIFLFTVDCRSVHR